MSLTATPVRPTAILSALLEEQRGLLPLLQQPRKVTHAGRDFWCGQLHGQPVVLTPFTLSGAMAPATIAGALALQNAEALAGIDDAGRLAEHGDCPRA